MPAEIQLEESTYIGQLLRLYEERAACSYPTADAALASAEFGRHLRDQRIRFFDAVAFDHFYRDSTYWENTPAPRSSKEPVTSLGSLEDWVPRGHPFNSTLETGIRALVVLEAFYPRRCDLTEMTWLDHLVVHTGDLDGEDVPESLHPDLPNRAGELLVRRQLVQKSLRIMQQVHLVDVFETETGIEFCASQEAPSYLDLLQAPYSLALKARARWMAEQFASMTTSEIRVLVEARFGRWTAEFRADETPTGRSAL